MYKFSNLKSIALILAYTDIPSSMNEVPPCGALHRTQKVLCNVQNSFVNYPSLCPIMSPSLSSITKPHSLMTLCNYTVPLHHYIVTQMDFMVYILLNG